jgi:curved DNA-binding protein CbpA
MAGFRDPYRILQLDPSAVPEVVDAAYRALARLHHPDMNRGSGVGGQMTELNWAYAMLRDPEKRAAYDKERQAAQAAVAPTAPMTPAPTSLRERMQGTVAAAAASAPEPQGTLRSRMGAAAPAPPAGPGAGGPPTLDFGRYNGMTLAQVARADPEYLHWLRRHSSGFRFRRHIDELLSGTAKRASG